MSLLRGVNTGARLDRVIDAAMGDEDLHSVAGAPAVAPELRRGARADQSRSEGDRRIKLMYATIAHAQRLLDIELSTHQQRAMDIWVTCALPQLYGVDTWEYIKDEVMADAGVSRIYFESVMSWPRQSGKSTCVAIYAAAALLCIYPQEIRVYAITSDQSKIVVKEAWDLVCRLLADKKAGPAYDWSVKTDNVTSKVLEHKREPHKQVVLAAEAGGDPDVRIADWWREGGVRACACVCVCVACVCVRARGLCVRAFAGPRPGQTQR